FRALGYDILSMKTRSVITGAEAEVPADQAIRTALRLGDSALIIGEVRSVEARALYEAMRVGALAKTVAGTIHGAGPYDVYDRVVNDLGVPKTSFKATDVIVVANTITSPSGLERWRRLTQIAEVRKFWTEDPIAEKGFADLMSYNASKDVLEPTPVLLQGESEIIKAIGGRVKEWSGNWNAMWENIELRANIKETLVKAAQETKIFDLLEAPFVILSNDEFHRICAKVAEEVGYTDSKRVYSEWYAWLKQQIKKMKK
ncbi:MAG: ATPase, T2SS/T4P/T4SS family, partial [Candidatus Nanoarchaeia archaeon]